MNGYDWIAAATPEEAIKFCKEHELDGEEIEARELTDHEMDTLLHLGEDGQRHNWPLDKIPTFRQELMNDIAAGFEFPCHFATTDH
jgi:hypothetical protein